MTKWLALVKKDLLSELRRPQFLIGVLFFQFCLIFLFFLFQDGVLDAVWWSCLFWVDLLIAAMSLVLKNFTDEGNRQFVYFYQLTDAVTIYLSKATYNFLVLAIAGLFNYILFELLFESFEISFVEFTTVLISGVLGVGLSLTLVAFMAGFSPQAAILINILVLPIIIPLMLLLIRSTLMILENKMDNLAGDLSLIAGIDVLIMAMALGLFPYLWRR